MPARLVFHCEYCDAEPDPETHAALQRQLQELRFGEYVDAGPAHWLVWHGRGPYGPTRYACGAHRVRMRTYLRKHYGTIGWHPHARVLGDVPPGVHRDLAPADAPDRRMTDRQRRLLRTGSGFPRLA